MAIAYTGINGNNQALTTTSIVVTLSATSIPGDYIALAIFVQNTTGILPVVSSISDTNSATWINASGFEEIIGAGGKWYVGMWYALVPSPVTPGGDVITVTFSAMEPHIAAIGGEFSGVAGIDIGCNVVNSGKNAKVSAPINVATINEVVIAAVLPVVGSGIVESGWNIVDQLTGVEWGASSLLYIPLGNTSGSQTATPMNNVGNEGWAVALTAFIPTGASPPPSAPTSLLLSIFELNGGGNPIVLDATATGTESFTGGADTETPSFSAVLSNALEASISAIIANGKTVTMVQQPGYIPVLVPTGNTGLFIFYPGSEEGAVDIEPATLSASVDSAICVITFGAPQTLEQSLIISPVFPDTFSPRLAQDPYDSLTNDPTYTPNEFGPQPWTT